MLRRLHWITLTLCVVSSLLARSVQASDVGEAMRGARVLDGAVEAEGKTLTAGPRGATLSLDYGARLRAMPGTRFEFGRSLKVPMGAPPDPMIPARLIKMQSGTLETQIPPKTRFAVLVQAPQKVLVMTASGATTVFASEEKVTAACHEGAVIIEQADKWRRLPPGQAHVVTPAHPDGVRRALLETPGDPVLSRSLLLDGTGPDASSILAWPAVTGASEYSVQLRNAADGSLVREQRTTEPRLILAALAPGKYQVVVRALDDTGLPSPSSSGVALNVVGVAIPETANRAPDGTIRLQPDQRVSLIGAQGLELAYLGLDDFLPVPETLGLVARRPISLVLRHPESGETVRLNLTPLSIKARVEFVGDRRDWPYEGLEVRVKLYDEQGYAVPDNYAVTARVTINVAIANATWQREGSVLRTVLPRPPGSPPWMVRVEVLDQSGIPIGMDFTEVAYMPPRAEARQSR